MYCKHCFKQISDDSIYCNYCGRKLEPKKVQATKQPINQTSNKATTMIINGEKFTVRNGIVYDEDGWDVGRVPAGYTNK